MASAEASAREASCFVVGATTATALVFDFDVFVAFAFFALFAFSVAVAAFLLSFCVAAARLGAEALRETMREERERTRAKSLLSETRFQKKVKDSKLACLFI